MRQQCLFLFAAAATLLASCHKDNAPQPEQFPTYLPLATGNSWVYQRYTVSWATGQATPTNVLDSCFISKDTLIRGNTYYKLVRPHYIDAPNFKDILYLRDSLHYLVDWHGRRLFSSQDRTSVLARDYVTYDPRSSQADTICEVTARMAAQPATVLAPAGSFTVEDYQQLFRYYQPFSHHTAPRTMHTTYAQNVGIITETIPFYLSSPDYFERRLVRYHLR